MIVSHKLQCIFIAIPKTATHAIRFCLRKHLDNQRDWEQVGLFVHKKSPFAELAKIDTGHIKAIEAKPVLGKALWSEYFKFAVVRNPYDRFVSFCAFINREDLTYETRATERMKQIIVDSEIQHRILFRPQYEFICDSDKNLMIDAVIRYENLQNDYEKICVKLNIRDEILPKVNRSVRGPYANYYDAELQAAVFKFYRQDFALFGYSEQI